MDRFQVIQSCVRQRHGGICSAAQCSSLYEVIKLSSIGSLILCVVLRTQAMLKHQGHESLSSVICSEMS
jgi:hypothetical protein